MFEFIIFKSLEILNFIEQKIVNSYFTKIFFNRISIEPIKKEWINISWLDNHSIYKDNYNIIPIWFFRYNRYISNELLLKNIMKSTLHLDNSKSMLFIYKNDTKNIHITKEITLSSIKNQKYLIENILFENNTNTGCKKFIFIEYFDPDSNFTLNIKLDNNYFNIGNDILSSTFIKRYLEYNYGRYCRFNINYKINIIDGDISFFSLDKHYYITIEKDCYSKKRI
jgi:hypothetical protein